jgi:glycosyltransferase involved in cell wall biosynthesis
MKILYVITKGNWGGAQKYVFDIASHLPKEHWEPVVAYGEGAILPAKLSEVDIRTIQLKKLGRDVHIANDINVFFDLIALFKKEKPDIVHLNSSKIGGLGALAARVAGLKKIIFTVHGFAFNEARPLWQKKIIAFISWLTLIFCTDIIFISQMEMNRACAWPGIRHKATLIYNGIENPLFLEQEESRKKISEILGVSQDIFDNKIIIGTIAELTENKGLHFALEAITHTSNVIYIIIGHGELERELKEQIEKKGLTDKVYLTGFMKDASHVLKAFDIFLLPSVKEGVPYVILEAGFAQIPVVATDVGGIPEIITDTVSGRLIPPKKSSEIQHALEHIISHPEVRELYAQKLYEQIKNNFTFETTLKNTLQLYEK